MKGVFQGQTEAHGSLSSCIGVPRKGKGAYQRPPANSMASESHLDTTETTYAPPPSQRESEQSNEPKLSLHNVCTTTRSISPLGDKRAASLCDFPVPTGKSFKIVLDEGQPKPAEPEKPKPHPQESMNEFWANFDPDYLGKITRILPDALIQHTPGTSKSIGETAQHAVQSYEQARERCIRDVKKIIRECRGLNKKYTDTHFDLELDLKITRQRDCLDSLLMDRSERAYPHDVKRVCDIFESPTFFADGARHDDIIQGTLGDCWLLAAFSILTGAENLVRRVCVIQDQDVGVYGFVFYRDGDWHQCIIDDKLYLRAPSYDESGDVVLGMYGVKQQDQERSYDDMFQKGSKSLFFASCQNENETWVPLLEKALAKAHGAYSTLSGGHTGEAIEDLTGGVSTEIYTTNILNKNDFWYNELRRIGKDFVFSAAAASYREWRPSRNTSVREERRQGIVSRHAYAILDTYEGHGQRLVKVRNPWGNTEWNGPWSDGSREWTSEWIERLNHKFGNDGIFWISYEDLLKKYKYLDRTRIFGQEWHIAQQWASVQVPWNTNNYQAVRFSITVPDDTDAVIVLSQLDDRYFQGLQGKYDYTLQFRVQKDDEDDEEYIARSPLTYELERSSNVEVKLEKGTYSVLFKVEASKSNRDDVETVVRNNIGRKEKLMQVGALYDLAHQKGQLNSWHGEDVTKSDTSGAAQPATTSPAAKTTPKKDNPNRDPWNAACVVGLRVYSKQPELGLKVVLPSSKEDTAPATLDRDDIAKAALNEAQANSEQQPEMTVDESKLPAANDEATTEQLVTDTTESDEKTPEKTPEEKELEEKKSEDEGIISDVISISSATEIEDLAGDKAAYRCG